MLFKNEVEISTRNIINLLRYRINAIDGSPKAVFGIKDLTKAYKDKIGTIFKI